MKFGIITVKKTLSTGSHGIFRTRWVSYIYRLFWWWFLWIPSGKHTTKNYGKSPYYISMGFNQLSKWQFSSSQAVCLPEGTYLIMFSTESMFWFTGISQESGAHSRGLWTSHYVEWSSSGANGGMLEDINHFIGIRFMDLYGIYGVCIYIIIYSVYIYM